MFGGAAIAPRGLDYRISWHDLTLCSLPVLAALGAADDTTPRCVSWAGPAPASSAQPPSDPLVDGTSSLARGSMATAERSARASPLKHDSDMWWSLVP